MTNIWLVSDSHHCHSNILKYCNRPFKTVEEMDETLIQNWNKVVKTNDTVYHLGDFGFGSLEELESIFNRLNGQKHLIAGNHDKHSKKLKWIFVKDTYELNVGDKYYWLAHYAHRTWNKSFHGSRHFYGHSHGMMPPYGFSCDVGVDCWGYSPVNIDELEQFMSTIKEQSKECSTEIWRGRAS